MLISPLAVVHPSAQLAQDVRIGPWVLIEENAVIGSGCRIDAHAVIGKNTRLGSENHVFHHAVLGTDPQHRLDSGQDAVLEIGNGNIIREFVTAHRGTGETGFTRIGSHNYFMCYAHVAHDCVVGNHITFANNASIAGHVVVEDHALLSAFSGAHQFVTIGSFACVGAASMLGQDLLPYMLATGIPGAHRGLNSVGLKRHRFTSADLMTLKHLFRLIFHNELKKSDIIESLKNLLNSNRCVAPILQAMTSSRRGIASSHCVKKKSSRNVSCDTISYN